MSPNWSRADYRPEDLLSPPWPWRDRLAADIAASGGASTVTAAEALVGVARGALEHRILGDGVVLVRDRSVPSQGWHALSGEFIHRWTRFARSGGDQVGTDRLTEADCERTAELLRARVVREHEQALAALPEADRADAEYDAERRREARRAELERDRERVAAELAALDDGTEPLSQMGEPAVAQPRSARRL